MNLLHIPELVLDRGGVTTIVWMAPRNNRFVCQERSKRTRCGFKLLHRLTPQLLLHLRCVNAVVWIAAKCGKCAIRGLNLQYTPQLILDHKPHLPQLPQMHRLWPEPGQHS